MNKLAFDRAQEILLEIENINEAVAILLSSTNINEKAHNLSLVMRVGNGIGKEKSFAIPLSCAGDICLYSLGLCKIRLDQLKEEFESL